MGLWHVIISEEGTNLVSNPSFETNATGWTAGGTNTIARSSAQAFKGAYSGLLTYGNTATGMVTITPSPSASTTYYFSCWLYVPANWDGGNIYIDAINYTSAVETVNYQYAHGTSPTAIWVYLETKVVFDADVTGTVGLTTSSAPTATRTCYLDAFQMEQNASYPTTYIDGDQPGCKWSGLAHGSTSTRSSQERSGGRVLDLEDTYSIRIRHQAGSGMAFSSHKSQKQALMPGALFRGTKAEPRTMTLLCTPKATSAANLHAIRDDLIDAVKPDLVSGDREVTLRYTGANSNKPVEIRAVYDSGLEFGEPSGKIEHIPMRFIAYDPYWYEIGNGSAALTTSVSETHYYTARQVSGNWENFGPTTSGPVYIVAVADDYIYVGGDFLNWDDNANADCIVRYDKATGTWSALGTGCNGIVRALVVAPNGDLYAGGDFTSAGGVANTDGIAYWDISGASWTALGTGISGGTNRVRALLFDQSGNLYAGGDFTAMGGVANTAYIAKWNGTAWSALSTGLGAYCTSLALASDGGIFIGGNFTNLGDANGDYVVKWSGSAWSSLSTGLGARCSALVTDNAGNLYAGGDFTTAGGVTVNYIARWNGTRWYSLGGGADDVVWTLQFIDGLLYAEGGFTSMGDITADQIAIWNGTSWAHLDVDTSIGAYAGMAKDPNLEYLYLYTDTLASALTSGVTTVINNGTARAYPKVTIKRSSGTSATVAYLKNQITGATLWLNYALLDGETLTLDFAMGARKIESSMFGTVWRALLKPSDFSQFYLQPGANDIIAFVNPVGSPTVTALMTYPLTHWSVDGVA